MTSFRLDRLTVLRRHRRERNLYAAPHILFVKYDQQSIVGGTATDGLSAILGYEIVQVIILRTHHLGDVWSKKFTSYSTPSADALRRQTAHTVVYASKLPRQAQRK